MSDINAEWEQDLARRIGIPLPTLRAMRHQGRGPEHFRIGRRIYYTPEAISAWLTEQQNAAS